jgi:hypothetical protein
MQLTRLASLLGLLGSTSCTGSPSGPICRDPARLDPIPAGILVVAFDSVTMVNATIGARIVARQSATVADSINSADANAVWVGRIAGAYGVTVTKAGYHPWTRAGVNVQSDVCGLIPVQVTALLQPL